MEKRLNGKSVTENIYNDIKNKLNNSSIKFKLSIIIEKNLREIN
jgi:hypothetical protein